MGATGGTLGSAMSQRFFLKYDGRLVELLDGGSLVIGRGRRADLPINDASASREHCRIDRDMASLEVVDLDSRNGVLVNGERIAGRGPLFHGDVITLGSSSIVVMVQARAPSGALSFEPYDGEDDEETTLAGGNRLEVFASGAEQALADDELMVAEMSVRHLLRGLRTAHLSKGRVDERLAMRALELALELADRTRDRAWLGEARVLPDAFDIVPSSELERRRAQLEAEMIRPS